MAIFMVSIRYISGRVSPFILHFLFRSHGGSKIPISKMISLPETNSLQLKMDVWKTILSCWDGISFLVGGFNPFEKY